MNNSANSNIYSFANDAAWERFEAHLSGNRSGFVCVISNSPLSANARTALEASMERLGYGAAACTFITLFEDRADGSCLSDQDLLELIEGLDPRVVIAADSESARLFGRAFRTAVPLLDYSHVAGRRTIAFGSFQSMLEEASDKQRAWALLKRLARQ